MAALIRLFISVATLAALAACGGPDGPETLPDTSSDAPVETTPNTPTAPTETPTARAAPIPTAAPTSTTVATVVPYRFPFEASLVPQTGGGVYESGRRPCDRGLHVPLWTTVTDFVWVCEDRTAISLDATVSRERWVAQLPSAASLGVDGQVVAATAAVGDRIVDVARVALPAVGLSAETYELRITVLDGRSGEVMAEPLVSPMGGASFWVWWAPFQDRVVVAFDNDSATRVVLVVDAVSASIVGEFTNIRVLEESERIDGRFVPVEVAGDTESVRFVDLETGEFAAATARLHRSFDHVAGSCSPFVLVKADLFGEWHLVDPADSGPSVPLPDGFVRDAVTPVGALIRGFDEWAMFTPAGIIWTLDRSVARNPVVVGGELSFENPSGLRIAVDPATGAEAGPAMFDQRPRLLTSDGYLLKTGRQVEYVEVPTCA